MQGISAESKKLLANDAKIGAIQKISKRLFWSLAVLIPVLVFIAIGPREMLGLGNAASPAPEPNMIYLVLGFGALGAFVSLQRRLKALALDDLLLISESWVNAWLVPLVGGVLAAVLYCLFLSGLLSGALFPKFCKDLAIPSPSPLKALFNCHAEAPLDYAKLFFWSFLAGFSEKFVVNIIGQFERRRVR